MHPPARGPSAPPWPDHGQARQRGSAGRGWQSLPTLRAAHVDGSDGLNPGPRRLNAEEARGLAALDAAPEFPFRGEQQVLVERVGENGHFHLVAAAGDDGEDRGP